jgi:hypothetical protein
VFFVVCMKTLVMASRLTLTHYTLYTVATAYGSSEEPAKGYYPSEPVCNYKCPANSIPIVQCLVDFSCCQCSTGYAMNQYGNGCDLVQVDVDVEVEVQVEDKKSLKILKCIGHGYSKKTCEKNYGSYRHLKQVDARHLVEADDKCSEEDYDMYLVIHGAHFAGLATPKTTSHKCPSVVFHAEASDSSSPMEKIALHAEQEDIDAVDEDAMLHLGVKSLGDIVWAFENAPVGKTGTLYDAVSNNCVGMLRNMADPLDIAVDDRMVRFVTHKLLEGSTEHIFEMMKESPAFSSIFNGGRRLMQRLDNHDLLANVIKLYA